MIGGWIASLTPYELTFWVLGIFLVGYIAYLFSYEIPRLRKEERRNLNQKRGQDGN